MKTPGCYGLAIVHSKVEQCKGCQWRPSCRETALKNLKQLDGVEDIMKHYTDIDDEPVAVSGESDTGKVDVTIEEFVRISTMPVKAQKLATAMCRKGIKLKSSLLAGKNPFKNNKPSFLKAPCDLLIEGGFTTRELRSVIRQSNPDWSEGTVNSQASIALALFKGFGCVEMKYGYFKRASK